MSGRRLQGRWRAPGGLGTRWAGRRVMGQRAVHDGRAERVRMAAQRPKERWQCGGGARVTGTMPKCSEDSAGSMCECECEWWL